MWNSFLWVTMCSMLLGQCLHGPLARYEKLQVAHAPGMPGTFSLPPRVSDSDMHHGTCVTHVPWCIPGSLISGFRWSRWRGNCSRHSRRMRNPRFYVSGKRPMERVMPPIFWPIMPIVSTIIVMSWHGTLSASLTLLLVIHRLRLCCSQN